MYYFNNLIQTPFSGVPHFTDMSPKSDDLPPENQKPTVLAAEITVERLKRKKEISEDFEQMCPIIEPPTLEEYYSTVDGIHELNFKLISNIYKQKYL